MHLNFSFFLIILLICVFPASLSLTNFVVWKNTIEQLLCSNLVICNQECWINCVGCLSLLWHYPLSNWKGCSSCR